MTREEAIKMLKSKMDGNTDTSYEWAETVRMAIKALEQEPCEDCVKREDIIKHICESKECYKAICKGRLYKRCFDIQWVYDLPSVTPKGVTITDFADKCRECGREKVLDKIRAEIWDLQYGNEEKSMTDEDRADAYNNAIRQVIDIIDKYKAESEE